MSRTYSLAVLGIVISAAWCVQVASEAESNSLDAASRKRRRKLESIHVVGDDSNGATSMFEVSSHATDRKLGIGPINGDKSSKGEQGKKAKDSQVKSAKDTKDSKTRAIPMTRGVGGVGNSDKSSKAEKVKSAKDTKDTKNSKTRTVPKVQQVNEEVKKAQKREKDNAAALLQMVLSDMSMSMDLSSSDVDTMNGIVAGTIDVIDNDSPSEESPDVGDGGDVILVTEPTLTVDDSPPSTPAPVKATVNNAEGTNAAKDGATASFSVLPQLIAVTIVAISIISVSFD